MSIPGVTAGERIWHRCARVSLNGKKIAEHLPQKPGHRIVLRIARTNRLEPNTGEVQIYGLAKEVRTAISSAFDAARKLILAGGGSGSIGDLVVEAGYDGVLEQVGKMDIISIEHEEADPGYVTTIKAQDGIFPFKHSVVSESLAPGVDVNLVKTVLAQSMRVAFLDADSEAAFQQALSTFQSKTLDGGLVLTGPSRKATTELLESLKLAWTYQDGKMVLLRFDGTKLDKAVLLGPQSGLQRFAEREEGRAVAHARLNGKLSPGRQVSVVDGFGKPKGAGIFRVDNVTHNGDTDGGAWESACDLRPSAVPV
jgi:hypothetical protein